MVRVKSKVSFPHASNKQINLDEKACTLRDRTAVTCTQLAICMEYDGVGADDVIGKKGIIGRMNKINIKEYRELYISKISKKPHAFLVY